MDKYKSAIKENICSVCIDSDDDGICTLTEDETCAVDYFLPQIVDIVRRNHHSRIEELENKLRDEICSDCQTSAGKEYCYLREDANCALDRYFGRIVEVIQKVDSNS
jgi:hypothetical protein